MTSINPWNFESIEDFHFYCCPECDIKTKESQDFMNHAVQHHAKSIPIRTLKNFILNLKVIDSDPLSVVPSIKKINLKVKKPVVKLQRLTESKILYHTSPKKVAKEENNKLIYNDVEDNLDQEDKELKTENDLSIDFDSVEQGMDEDQRDENMFLCLMCEEVSSSQEALVKHMESNHPNESKEELDHGNINDTKNENMEEEVDVSDHEISMEENSDEDFKLLDSAPVTNQALKFKCNVCDKRFISREQYSVHVDENHMVEGGYLCKECDWKWKTKHQWLKHNRVVHGNPEWKQTIQIHKFKCDVCNIRFVLQEKFSVHVDEIHKVEGGYLCKDGKIRKTKKEWLVHNKLTYGKLAKVANTGKPIFECDKCDSSFVTENELIYHFKLNHIGRVRNVCYNCETLFQDYETFIAHVESKHKVNDMYTCVNCDTFKSKAYKLWLKHTKFCIGKTEESIQETEKTKLEIECDTSLTSECDTKDDTKCDTKDDKSQESKFDLMENHVEELLDIHKKNHSRQNINCTVCNIEFTKITQLIQHTKEVHKVPGGYECKECDTIKASKKQWSEHLLSTKHILDKDRWKCHECDIVFENRSALHYHNKKVHDGPKTCDKCGKEYSSIHDLNLHIRRVHHVYEISEDQKVKKCDQCDTEFKAAVDFDEHLKSVHKCDKDFKCKECDLAWTSHLSLELHYIESHKKIMFCCNTCGYTTYQPAILQRHQRNTHEGKRDHVCHVCGQAFTKKFLLTDHLSVAHGIGECRFKCDYCGKSFMNLAAKKIHVEGVHEKNKIYHCDVCSYVGPTKNALTKHRIRIHGIYKRS